MIYYSSFDGKQFRHYYSDIFSTLSSIQQNNKLGSINILGENLSFLFAKYVPCRHFTNKEGKEELYDIRDNLKKLYDHVSLDIARISYANGGDWSLSKEKDFKELERKLETAEDTIQQLNTQLKKQQNELTKSVESVKIDYITILGLFSGIIITFVAGLVFSGSVLENMHNGSIYRISLIVLMIAFFVYNLVFSCYHFIEKITLKNSDKENKKKSKHWIAPNIVIIVMVVITIFLWSVGAVENRNEKYDDDQNSISEIQ